jgi:hypothetical protein
LDFLTIGLSIKEAGAANGFPAFSTCVCRVVTTTETGTNLPAKPVLSYQKNRVILFPFEKPQGVVKAFQKGKE